MPNCPKCGAKTSEAMNFCANCGASLKPSPPVAQVAAPAAAPAPAPPLPQPSRPEKYEKQEKAEKREKAEKTEKHEKREYGYTAPIIGGIILIALGLFFYLTTIIQINPQLAWAYFLIIIGIAVISITIYLAATAARRHPPT